MTEPAAIPSQKVLDLLTSLVDASLVVYEEQSDGAGRYRLLETTRQYAGEKLEENGEDVIIRKRHRDYFLLLAEEAKEKLYGAEQGRWLNRLETEHDNLRQAVHFCLQDSEGGEAGLRFGSALWWFWHTLDHQSEGREHLAALLSHALAQERSNARADALQGAGVLAYYQEDYVSARSLHEESMAIRRELDDRRGIANCLLNLGIVAYNQSDYVSARSFYEESMAISRALEDNPAIAISLNILGAAAADQAEYASARTLCTESLAIRKALGDRRGIASCLNNLGRVAADQGDYSSAWDLHMESLAISRELGSKPGIAKSLHRLGIVAYNQGEYVSSRTLFEESLAIWREIGGKRGIGEVLDGLASLAAKEQKWETFARLRACAEALRETMAFPLPASDRERADREIATARQVLGASEFATAWTEGRALTLEQVIAYACTKQAEN